MPFQQFGLSPALLRNVVKLGYTTPTPIQTQAIPAVQGGRDVVATAQTGTGKTAAFLLPVLHQLQQLPRSSPAALVLTPTRELAQQIDGVFRGLAATTGLRSALIVGGAPAFPQERALRAGVEFVVATPGRLLDLMNRGAMKVSAIRTLVLDEADQMFDMGFLPDLRRIIAKLPAQRQTLLFSATMPPEIAKLGQAILRDPMTVAVDTEGTAARTVTQLAYPVPMARKAALLQHLLEQWEMPSALVFTRTKQGARRLSRTLYDAGHSVAELHSDRTPAQRLRAMEVFRARRAAVMVATNIAARGIDVRHITHVVNYDVPNAPEEYVHRIGRTGRGGDQGDALILVSPEEHGLLARIERKLGQRIQRQHVEDFDYSHGPGEKRRERGAPGSQGERPYRGGNRQPVGVGAYSTEKRARKPYRGQGGRR